MDRVEWDVYKESSDLIPRVEKYKQDKGFDPKRVCADQIYMTQANRMFCKEHGIRLSGRPLGRPKKDPLEVAEQRELFREDQRKRNAIEGRFGTAKRKYNLERIMAKLEQTARRAISMVFVVMNAETLLRLWRLIVVLIFMLISGLQKVANSLSLAHERENGYDYFREEAC